MRTGWDVRIGEYRYRLADNYGRELLGLVSRWIARSITATQAGVVGAQNVENLDDEKLRWLITSFAAGEGQKVLIGGDPISERRYDRSLGVDLSHPGQVRLGKTLEQLVLSPTSVMTDVPASAFIDEVGTSTMVGDDRRLEAKDDRVGHTTATALGAGSHQFELWAYTAPTSVIQADEFEVKRGIANLKEDSEGNMTDRRLRMGGEPRAVVIAKRREPGKTQVQIAAVVRGFRKEQKPAKSTVVLRVRNAQDTVTITEKTRTLQSSQGDYDEQRKVRLTFDAKADTKYRYRLDLIQDNAQGVDFDLMEEHILAPAKILAEVRQGTTDLLSRTVDITGVTEPTKVLSSTFSSASGTVTIRMTRLSPTVATLLHRASYSDVVQLVDGDNMELGQGGALWLVDQDPGAAASVFRWDPDTRTWSTLANIGPVGGRAIALAHSDSYEYALVTGGGVFRLDGGGVAYTTVTDGVGLAVGADRLWVLSESTLDGTKLHRGALDQTSVPITMEAVYTAVGKGITPDTTLVRRVAGTPAGCVFFVNRSTRCSVYEWDEASQSGRVLDEFPGFQGRGITYGRGLAFLVGEQPATGGGTRAAMFVIDLSTGPASSDALRLPFERERDPDSYLQDVQMYGNDVYALAHVTSDPPLVRMWRVSLSDPGGLVLEHETEMRPGAIARALAVSDRTVAMVSTIGGPWVAQDNYVSDGFLRTSLYNFLLLEEKRLTGLIVDGIFPEGTSLEVAYSGDEGPFIPAGIWTEPERRPAGDLEQDITFRNLALELRPRTSDPSLTPMIYSVEAVTAAAFREQMFDLVLMCTNENAVFHTDGSQATGAEGIAYIRSLIAGGVGLVEFEDRYTNPRDPRTYLVELKDPQIYFVGPGEAVVRLTAVQR